MAGWGWGGGEVPFEGRASGTATAMAMEMPSAGGGLSFCDLLGRHVVGRVCFLGGFVTSSITDVGVLALCCHDDDDDRYPHSDGPEATGYLAKDCLQLDISPSSSSQ